MKKNVLKLGSRMYIHCYTCPQIEPRVYTKLYVSKGGDPYFFPEIK